MRRIPRSNLHLTPPKSGTSVVCRVPTAPAGGYPHGAVWSGIAQRQQLDPPHRPSSPQADRLAGTSFVLVLRHGRFPSVVCDGSEIVLGYVPESGARDLIAPVRN